MEGYGKNIGVSPRAIAELFDQIKQLEETWNYSLTLSMLEIYNETIRDLLDSSSSKDKEKLDIRQTPDGNQVIGLTDVTISSVEQVRELMKQGQNNRAVGSHDMNEHSSRSHSILTVTCRGTNKLDGSTTFGKSNRFLSSSFFVYFSLLPFPLSLDRKTPSHRSRWFGTNFQDRRDWRSFERSSVDQQIAFLSGRCDQRPGKQESHSRSFPQLKTHLSLTSKKKNTIIFSFSHSCTVLLSI
jgi:hypothetical protein